MIKSCTLLTPIAPTYYRNNRSTRQKSLRCFPGCSVKGHVTGGFCGTSLRVRMTLASAQEGNGTIDINDFMIISEMRPLAEPKIASLKTIKKQDVMDKIRTKQVKEIGNREIFMGEIDIVEDRGYEVDVNIEFNSQHQSWDYSWRSNRWTGQQHVVDIIVLSYLTPSEFAVCSYFTSNSFVLVSSHKKSPGKKGIAPEVATSSSDLEAIEVIEASQLLSGLADFASVNGKNKKRKRKVTANEDQKYGHEYEQTKPKPTTEQSRNKNWELAMFPKGDTAAHDESNQDDVTAAASSMVALNAELVLPNKADKEKLNWAAPHTQSEIALPAKKSLM